MKARVKFTSKSPHNEWEIGDLGIIDGYYRGGDNIPYAIVILDRTGKFVMAELYALTFTSWERDEVIQAW